MRKLLIMLLVVTLLVSPVSAGEVILTSEKLLKQAEILKNIHESHGVDSTIVTVEEIWKSPEADDPPFSGYATGKDHHEIVGYNYTLAKKIISYLRNHSAEYVTIFGDADVVPPSYYAYFKGQEIPTDYFYADPDYDMHAEFAVGRIPVSTTEEAEKVVDKIKKWYSELSAESFSKAVVIGTKIYTAYGLRPSGQYIEDAEVWQGELAAVHIAKHLSRFDYAIYLQSDSLGNADPIRSALDDAFSGGYGLVLHYGHGIVGGIDMGGIVYTTRYLLQVSKTKPLLPIVISSGCTVAAYDDELVSEVRDYFTDHPFSELLLLHDAGGIAFIGFTRTTRADYFYESTHVTQEGYADNGFVAIEKDDVRFADYIIMRIVDELGTGKPLGAAFRDALNDYMSSSVEPAVDVLLKAELIGDPTLQLPALEQREPPASPMMNVESEAASIETPCRWINGMKFCDGTIPKFVGSVRFSFNEPVTVKIFNLSVRSVPLVLKLVGIDHFTFSPEGSAKYLLRASNGKREVWYVFYAEPAGSSSENISISYPKIISAEVGKKVEVTIEVSGSENAECELISAPEGAACSNLTFAWTPERAGNYTVVFRVTDGSSSADGRFTVVVSDPRIPEIDLVYPENGATGVELSPLLKVRIDGPSNYTAEFYTKSGELIGVCGVENGYAVVKWSDLEAGTVYEWYVVVKWNGGEKTSDVYEFKTSECPEANFEYSVNGNVVEFVSTSSDPDGQSLSCSWNFGDGSRAEGCRVSHEFEPGSYEVTLTVTDTTGLSDSVTKLVVVVKNTSQVELPTGSKDLDGDGLYEDVNGDGALNFRDVIYLREHLAELRDYVRYYDFNPDCTLNNMDVLRLYVYWKWGIKYWEVCRKYGWCSGCG